MWSLWIILHFIDSFQWTSYNRIKYLPKLHKCIPTPSLRKQFSKILLYFVVYLWPNTLNFISLIFKVAVTWTTRPFDNENSRVLQIFSTKANLVCILSSVFMLFYLLLHSARAYKMHAFRMLHFMMWDCMMMHCLMTQRCKMQCYVA